MKKRNLSYTVSGNANCSLTLLVGMQTDTATMENSKEIP